MALTISVVPPLDPNLYTGPSRIQASGPVRIRAVTADTPYGEFATWLWVGTSGDVSIVCWDGTTIILNGVVAGEWIFTGSIMVNSSGTTATEIRWGS